MKEELEKLEEFKSPDPQVRCNAFYELFGDSEKSKLMHSQLYKKTTKEVYDLLGKPSHVFVLEHKGVKWLRVDYQFEVCPSAASKEEREAWEKGWQFAPMIFFRNGVSVPFKVMVKELELFRYQAIPENLQFKAGGSFP